MELSLISLIGRGIFIGLTLSILIGPLFMALIQTSIEKGMRTAAIVALGIWISDIIIMVIVLYFLHFWGHTMELVPEWSTFLGIIGALILIGMGYYKLRLSSIHSRSLTTHKLKSIKTWTKYLSIGFSLNTFNPFTIFFWTGLGSTYILDTKLEFSQIQILFFAVLATIICTDTIKILISKQLRKYLDNSKLKRINSVVGFLFIIMGSILGYKSLLLLS